MAAREAIAIYRDAGGDIENSFVLLKDGSVYSIEDLVKQYFIKQLRPSSRVKIRINVGKVNASAELAWQGDEKIAEVTFDPNDVIAIVSMERQNNKWLWGSAVLRFSSQKGSIIYDKEEDKDRENLVARIRDVIYFVPEGDEKKKIAMISETRTVPLAIINRAINKAIVEGDFDDEEHEKLLKMLRGLRNPKDPPEAFPVEKLNEIENLLKENGFVVDYNRCDLMLDRYVNELPINEIKKIMSKGKRNIRIVTNFNLEARPPPEDSMEMYVFLRNYSQYEENIVYYARGRDVKDSMNRLTDLAIQFNYCRDTYDVRGRWHYYDLMPC